MSHAFRPCLSPALLAAVAFAACFASASEASAQAAFVAQMRGSVNVPSNPSAAKGAALAVLDTATSKLTYQVDVSGLTGSVTSAEADWAAVGANGPVLFTLEGAAPYFTGTSPALTPEQVTELQAGRVYFTVRTSAYPLGQIRGQLTLGASQFYTLLSGAKVVPPSPTSATGYANFGLLADGIQLTCMVHASPLSGGNAFLKQGAPGTVGTTIATIPYDGSGVWHAVVPLNPTRVEMLKAGLVYVEIPSTPDAVVRGQLTSTVAHFGTGAGATVPPVLKMWGTPTPNSFITMELKGGVANSFALLLVSTNAGLATAAGCPIYVALPAQFSYMIPLDPNGTSYLPFFQLPAAMPTPLAITCQGLFANPAAANGHFTSSNGGTFNITTFPD